MQAAQAARKEGTARRRERGGRAARHESRARGRQQAGPPYIERTFPPYEIMSEDGLVRIEAAADRILADVGIELSLIHI